MNKIITLLAIVFALSGCNYNRSAPERRVHRLLIDRTMTLATAESCTGGTIAARFTALSGASAYFKCGVVAYGLEAKRDLLQVPYDSMARYGLVSEQVVRQMAEGMRRSAKTHFAIATTGIAGPTGGTPETPLGTVWIAVSTPVRTVSTVIHAEGKRSSVIRQAGTAAIELLEAEILSEGNEQ